MNKFLKQDYDKFKDKTTTTLVNPISVKRSEEHSTMWISEKSDFNLRHISMPDLNTLVMDIHTNISRTDDLGAGNLLMIIDDSQRYTLKAHESYSSPYESIKKISCWYEISTDLLKAICDAQTIDLRITAQDDNKYADLYIEGNHFQWAAWVMYNGLIDSNAYVENIQTFVPKTKVSKSQSDNDKAQSDNGASLGLKLISLLFPIAGWVLYFVFKNDNSKKASDCAKCAWGGLVCGIILTSSLL